MNQKTALQRVSRGSSCLWVGAGVAVQLGRAGGSSPPNWNELVAGLEKDAGIVPPAGPQGYAARLDVVLGHIHRRQFQRELRTRILGVIARSIVDAWRRTRKSPPPEFVALAHLGFLMNPIVNFNIETLTSQALVAGSGPWKPIVFHPPIPDALTTPISSRETTDKKRYQRRVYHPHGAIDISGICVLTEREYRSLNGTLSLELATHSAFGLDLAIVGMSLDDAYLREQIERFRHQIASVIWLTSPPVRDELAAWCFRAQVEVVEVSWPDFWRDVVAELPGPESPLMAYEWLGLVMRAMDLLGTPMTDATNRILFGHEDEVALRSDWFWKALMHGEDAKFQPRDLDAVAPAAEMQQVMQDKLEIAAMLR